jgi:hypothetical protein
VLQVFGLPVSNDAYGNQAKEEQLFHFFHQKLLLFWPLSTLIPI